MPRLEELEVGDFQGAIGPGFVEAFAAQWRAAQEEYGALDTSRRGPDAPGPRRTLCAVLVDGMHEGFDWVQDVGRGELFVEVASCSHYSSIIAANF